MMTSPIRKVDRPRNSDGNQARVPEYFGSAVFDLRAMAKKLTPGDLEILSNAMKFGGKIDAQLADRVASAAREWSIDKGATHYCHWFQPQTGNTAEKHDAFLWFGKAGEPVERFTGQELLQSEPDASSFPSGGMRSTFEARGYTGWDPGSPMFILETENGKTLYIPSVFVSYHGEALDHKVPLLRSNDCLSAQAVKTLHALGETQVKGVIANIGAEQEFFLVDKSIGTLRPDLTIAGRSLFGRAPTKGQELEDHYFANIPNRVQSFFNELEVELYKVGVPIKTRHNEVAPGQFEVAPIFESCNIACDHNQLVMKFIGLIAARHGLMALLHEKPFAGVNGSGKHVNWSMSDSAGKNLLDPGKTPDQNLIFLTMLAGVLQGIYDHADVLRASIASAGNDHRLGANEAPPAIMSVFLGQNLDRILNAIESGQSNTKNPDKIMIDLGVSHVPELAKDNTDRNRTSPFAFTGNKFEFRAVGSSQSISYPTAILNTAVTSGLKKINDRLSKVTNKDGILEVLKNTFQATKSIRFEGNGYGDAWKQEASQRGLGQAEATPEALQVFLDPTKTQFLIDCKVFSLQDIHSRHAIQLERYIKQSLIECHLSLDMAQTGYLPSGMTYLSQLTSLASLHAQSTAGTNPMQSKQPALTSPAFQMAGDIGTLCSRVYASIKDVKGQLDKICQEDYLDHHNLGTTASAIKNLLLPKVLELRQAVDALEISVPDTLWPFPKYNRLLSDLGS